MPVSRRLGEIVAAKRGRTTKAAKRVVIDHRTATVAAAPVPPKPIDGDGGARGCRKPGSIKIGIKHIKTKKVGGVLPAWVQATSAPNVRQHQRNLSYTVEGQLVESKITHEDFPLKPWHTDLDWNLFVRPNAKYRGLMSKANLKRKTHPGVLECEWDTAFFPRWAWPQKGGRIWVVGRWIYDCGHPGKHGCRTEIHPPKAVASFRSEAVKLPGNRKLTFGTVAVLYIGRKGGYWTSPINDQDYEFRLPLPPRPTSDAVPRFKVNSKTGRLPVRPIITPTPKKNPKALKVVIPLKGIKPHPTEYGAIISAGWSDPKEFQIKKIVPVRVTIKNFLDRRPVLARMAPTHLYVGVNGRWKVFILKPTKSGKYDLNFAVNLDLHRQTDKIHITARAFSTHKIHRKLMGKSTGLSPKIASERSTMKEAKKAAGKIRDKFLSAAPQFSENGDLGLFSQRHLATMQGTFKKIILKKFLSLEYEIRHR